MKIFIATLFLPKLRATHAGSRIAAETLRQLSRSHEIYLATRVEENELDDVDEIRRFCKNVYLFPYRKIEDRNPFTVLRIITSYLCFSYSLNGIINQNSFDIVQIEWVETGVLLFRQKIPMILIAHDVISKPAERSMRVATGAPRVLTHLKYLMIKKIELSIMKKFDMVLPLSEFDHKYLSEMRSDLDVMTLPVPAGLDITDKIYEKEKNTILYLASYKHRKINVDAAVYFYREVFPLVREQISDAIFIAAGHGPPDEMTSLAARDPHFVVPGFVENLDECYKRASVFVAPIHVGGGIIVKILDALAAGTPTVTTTYGNEGIGAEPGKDILVADSQGDFAAAVIRLLTDQEFARRVAENGQRFVRQKFTPDSAANKLEMVYRELIRSRCAK